MKETDVNPKSAFTFLPTKHDKYNGTLPSQLQVQEVVPVDSSLLLPVTKWHDCQTTILLHKQVPFVALNALGNRDSDSLSP
jgi:hypothetical protein